MESERATCTLVVQTKTKRTELFEIESDGLTNTPRIRVVALIRRIHKGVAVHLACPNDPTGVAGLASQRAGVWAAPPAPVAAVVRAWVTDSGVRIKLNGTGSGELARAVRAGRVGPLKCDRPAAFRHTR